MPIYTNCHCDDGFFPREPSLRSSIGIGPKVTKLIDAATKDWLDRHPEATTTVEEKSLEERHLKQSFSLELCRCFDTVADMQAAIDLKAGMTCHTNGFHVSGDGGAAYYIISASGVANGMDVLALQDELYATFVITEPYVTPDVFGAYGDGITDDTSVFAYVITNYSAVYIPNKRYLISSISVPEKDIVIDGVGTILVSDTGLSFNAPNNKKRISGISFEIDGGSVAMGFYGQSSTSPFNTLTIDNVTVKAPALSGVIGIDIQSENEALVSNTSLYGCAMNIINSINPAVVNCVFRHSAMGIYNANTDADRPAYACGLRVVNATILGCTVGVKSVQCDSIQIQSCMIDYNDYPIVILGTSEPVIENCYVSSRQGNTVIYIAKNNSDTGAFGGNGLSTESVSDAKIANCMVIQHDEALRNSAIRISGGQSHVISDVSVMYGGKACIELAATSRTEVKGCSLRSALSGAVAIVSYSDVNSTTLGDDSQNYYADINTVLPIYVRYARTSILTTAFATERHGTVVVPAGTTTYTISGGLPQGIDYVLLTSSQPISLGYSISGNNIIVQMSSLSVPSRINWIAYGAPTYSNFQVGENI